MKQEFIQMQYAFTQSNQKCILIKLGILKDYFAVEDDGGNNYCL